MEVLGKWVENAEAASPTSPRWEKAREMLTDIERVIKR